MSVDVCLFAEGSYPFKHGGVSQWIHDLIRSQNHLQFHLVALIGPQDDDSAVYELPKNLVGLTTLRIGSLPKGKRRPPGRNDILRDMLKPLRNIQTHTSTMDDLRILTKLIKTAEGKLGSEFLLNSEGVWNLLKSMYQETMSEGSFIDYFWSWRTLVSSLFSVLIPKLPEAGCYHAISTGYAGLMLARAHLETGRPTLLTEHGIYTNERRIELAMADWLYEVKSNRLALENIGHELRAIWVHAFVSYAQLCYESTSEIITLFQENRTLQLFEGASQAKTRLIPNGIDVAHYQQLGRWDPENRAATVALIARVVSIKDVISFVRAAKILLDLYPGVRLWVLGSMDEEPEYAAECRRLAQDLGIGDRIAFKGHVDIDDYLPQIDVVVLTSISEAQPLALLEAAAAGIPCVATDVGGCREFVFGHFAETPPLGACGAITPLANPEATAHEIFRLLQDQAHYERCREAAQKRVATYYNKTNMQETYRALYDHYLMAQVDAQGGFVRWQA